MNHLILIRHGQSIWNFEKRFTGWADIDLTDKGKSEAHKAGKLIKKINLRINNYFCSYQKRSINTLKIILDVIGSDKNQIIKAWELNERHYGELTGLNKDGMKKVYGENKIHQFRRSWNMSPAPLKRNSPYHPLNIDVYKNIPKNKIPDTESLKNTYERVVSYYTKNIEPLIQSRQNILISAHGNSLRALCKKLFNISEINISKLEIPTGNPLIIKFNKELKISDCYYLDITRSKDLLIKF
tara:strand:- start:673 stop:1395 length:723 start_codon:yes stop_codon:yes gene_type:complete